jgi:cytochrome c556
MKKLVSLSICLIFVALAVGGAYAQFAKPEDAIRYRKSVMFLILQHFGRMGAVVKGKTDYNQQAFTRNAKVMEALSNLSWEANMVPGTDKGDTTQNAAVFAKQDEFKASAQAFEAGTAKLVSVSQSGDLNAIKAQFGEVAKSCKSCHDKFRTN